MGERTILLFLEKQYSTVKNNNTVYEVSLQLEQIGTIVD